MFKALQRFVLEYVINPIKSVAKRLSVMASNITTAAAGDKFGTAVVVAGVGVLALIDVPLAVAAVAGLTAGAICSNLAGLDLKDDETAIARGVLYFTGLFTMLVAPVLGCFLLGLFDGIWYGSYCKTFNK